MCVFLVYIATEVDVIPDIGFCHHNSIKIYSNFKYSTKIEKWDFDFFLFCFLRWRNLRETKSRPSSPSHLLAIRFRSCVTSLRSRWKKVTFCINKFCDAKCNTEQLPWHGIVRSTVAFTHRRQSHFQRECAYVRENIRNPIGPNYILCIIYSHCVGTKWWKWCPKPNTNTHQPIFCARSTEGKCQPQVHHTVHGEMLSILMLPLLLLLWCLIKWKTFGEIAFFGVRFT